MAANQMLNLLGAKPSPDGGGKAIYSNATWREPHRLLVRIDADGEAAVYAFGPHGGVHLWDTAAWTLLWPEYCCATTYYDAIAMAKEELDARTST